MSDHPSSERGPAVVESAELRAASASSTLLAILAEFAGADPLPHAAVVRTMELVGIRAASGRQAISRAARAGALERPPRVQRGEVLLTSEGQQTLHEMHRGDDAPDPVWDGQWTLMSVRGRIDQDPAHATRNRLLLQGFGSLGGGLWIAPHSERSDAVLRLLGEDPTIDLVGGALRLLHPDGAHLVERAWDLDGIRMSYDLFGELADSLAPADPEGILAAWVRIRRQWSVVSRADPQLPEEALPPDWPGTAARARMAELRRRWEEPAHRAFRSL